MLSSRAVVRVKGTAGNRLIMQCKQSTKVKAAWRFVVLT